MATIPNVNPDGTLGENHPQNTPAIIARMVAQLNRAAETLNTLQRDTYVAMVEAYKLNVPVHKALGLAPPPRPIPPRIVKYTLNPDTTTKIELGDPIEDLLAEESAGSFDPAGILGEEIAADPQNPGQRRYEGPNGSFWPVGVPYVFQGQKWVKEKPHFMGAAYFINRG